MRTILLCEQGDETYLHGLFAIPNGKTDEQAQEDCENAREKARTDNPDEWDYDDVAVNLIAMGYQEISFIESWE